jgi:environmental stress-induced protein Ves
MIKFTRHDFKEMLWSNGGGSTTELFKLNDPFVFRLSVATVKSDGPFSLFPMIDRTLILLNGSGFHLNEKVLKDKFSPISLAGEEQINCSLINGECLDFNVMIDRRWGKTKTEILKRESAVEILAENKLKFVFDYENFELWKLEKEENIIFKSNHIIPLIVIEVYEN